ncbi:MAG: nucleotidyltransferase domain-containing protein [Chitinophagales bacterium]
MPKSEDIIQKIVALSSNKHPDAEVYLYGSQARGDANPLSDWDLLILLNRKSIPFTTETIIMDDFYELELQTGQIISPMIYSKEEWENKYQQTPFFESIQKESIKLK